MGRAARRGTGTRPWTVPVQLVPRPKGTLLSPLLLIYGFAGVIGIGTLLLWLPISNTGGGFGPIVDAFFTATSAVCVTGLVVVDTGTYWSSFGQGVILVLIQIGGFGFMTSATLLLLVLGRRIGLKEKLLIGKTVGMGGMGGLIGLVKRIALFTVLVEAAGAAILYIRFSGEGPFGTALWRSVFHSVSAFNNAGFDVFGNYRSLIDYGDDVLVVLVTAVLVIAGGIGFIVVSDVINVRRFKRLALDSKIVLTASAAMLAAGFAVILLTEFGNDGTLGAVSTPQRFLDAFFQSVTARTAGFTTVDIRQVADYTLFFTILLMFVGGAAGSTAGGIKVNTFGMLVATIWSSIRGKERAGAFGREFDMQQVHRALAVVMLSLAFVTVVVLVLTMTEPFKFLDLLFETVSAFGTVGLTTGITPELSIAGKIVIVVTMFVGRLGPLTLALSLIQRERPSAFRYPHETVRIG